VSDVVVISGGVDGLVAAHLLAAEGRRVTVVQEDVPADRTQGWVPPQVARKLGLQLAAQRPDPWLRAPLEGGGALELWRDMQRSVESIRRISPRDAGKWAEFSERMAHLGELLARIYVASPPSFIDTSFALRVRRLGRRGMEDLMRTLPMPIAELLDDWFESDALKGALGALAVADLHQGVRSAGTAFRLLHFHAGSPAGVFRPPSSNLGAVLRSRSGVTVRAGKAGRIAVRGGRVTGVVLEGGEELAAATVVSDAAPRRTLLELVDPGWLDPDLARAVGHIRSRGVAARVRLELERAPEWATLTLAPSLDYVERAYDEVKYRRSSAQPVIDAVADGAAVDVAVQYVADGAAPSLALLMPHLPAVKRQTVQRGQPHQAELSLDQALWMRPLPELAHYRTPIGGLWLCGQAMHPGAGVAGVSGYNCARAILAA
jgi:phytoene dehydrogenase-like protein